jgi:hypothetical protein
MFQNVYRNGEIVFLGRQHATRDAADIASKDELRMEPQTQLVGVAVSEPSSGVSGLKSARRNKFYPYKSAYPDDLGDCRVNRMRPWLIKIWEPISTNAPPPTKADPLCCYMQTVIFYDRFSGEEIDRIETRLTWDDVVTFDGDDWEIGGGKVTWMEGRWWMERSARRANPAL